MGFVNDWRLGHFSRLRGALKNWLFDDLLEPVDLVYGLDGSVLFELESDGGVEVGDERAFFVEEGDDVSALAAEGQVAAKYAEVDLGAGDDRRSGSVS